MKKLLKYTLISVVLLYDSFYVIPEGIGENMRRESLYEKLINSEQENGWRMLTASSVRTESSFKRVFKIYFIGNRKNEEIPINLFAAGEWPNKILGHYTLSPDASNIAFVISDYERLGAPYTDSLYILSVKTFQITNIISRNTFSLIGDICYSSDNRGIYFIGERSKAEDSLYYVDFQTSEIVELVENAVSLTTQACSSNTKEVVYVDRDNFINVYNVETKEVRRITKGLYPVWSPDGRIILFCEETTKGRNYYTIYPDGTSKELFLTNNDLHKFKIIGGITGEIDGELLWSPNNQYVYFVRAGTKSVFDTAEQKISYIMEIATKETIKLPKPTGRIKAWSGKSENQGVTYGNKSQG